MYFMRDMKNYKAPRKILDWSRVVSVLFLALLILAYGVAGSIE